jgi:hypothetical protein
MNDSTCAAAAEVTLAHMTEPAKVTESCKAIMADAYMLESSDRISIAVLLKLLST